jgi:hypothetical protein
MKEINIVLATDNTFIIRLLEEDGCKVLETAPTIDELVAKLRGLIAGRVPAPTLAVATALQ